MMGGVFHRLAAVATNDAKQNEMTMGWLIGVIGGCQKIGPY